MKISFIIVILLVLLSSGVVGQDIRVQKLSVSTGNDEMAPVLKDSVLYFSSNKQVTLLKRFFDENKKPLYHIFSSHLNADSSFSKPVRYEGDFLSPFNTSSIAFSADGSKMYLAQNHYDTYKRSQNSRSGNLIGVYQSEESDRGWSRMQNLSFNSRRDFNTAQPTVSDDGRFLFFISDMEGGSGKTDIYYSENINGEWGPAVNIGNQINTEESELFPYYHSSGKLYFASNGHGGQGGLDLFYSFRTADGWSDPVALDNEINTEANEFSCYISADEQWGLFASDRDGKDNLYRFDRLFPTFETCELQVEDNYCYEFFDDVTQDDEEKGPYEYQWTFDGKTKIEGDTVIHCFDGPGDYEVKLSMVDTSIDEEVFALSQYILEVRRQEQLYITSSDTIKVGQMASFDVSQSNLGDFTPRDYYWEMGDGTFVKGVTIRHIFRTKGKYIVKCGAVSSKHPQLKMCSTKEIIVID